MNCKMNLFIILYILNIVNGRLGDSSITGVNAYVMNDDIIMTQNELYFPRNVYTISEPDINNEINKTLIYTEIQEHLSQVKYHLDQVKNKLGYLRLNNDTKNETINELYIYDRYIEVPDESQLPMNHKNQGFIEVPDLSYENMLENKVLNIPSRISESSVIIPVNNNFMNIINKINKIFMFGMFIAIIKYMITLLNYLS
jgi:hypothetical protein